MIALVGSGEYTREMESVDRVLMERLGAAPRVVCLPTAAGREKPARIAYWNDLGRGHFRGLGADVEALPVLRRADACEAHFADRIRRANFVYFSGGHPRYLYETLNGTPVWDAVLAVLAGGGILAGCSAGAMIVGAKIPWLMGGTTMFGLVPGAVIIPHFNEISPALRGMLGWFVRREHTLLGLDGLTCLLMEGSAGEVLGAGSVHLRHAGRWRAGRHGERLEWP